MLERMSRGLGAGNTANELAAVVSSQFKKGKKVFSAIYIFFFKSSLRSQFHYNNASLRFVERISVAFQILDHGGSYARHTSYTVPSHARDEREEPRARHQLRAGLVVQVLLEGGQERLDHVQSFVDSQTVEVNLHNCIH